jgi:DNA-binding NarL/FixJ family response regulator
MLKILICDDHQLYRNGLALLVEQLDDVIEVKEAGSFPETMNAIAAHGPFDLILADLKMPLMGESLGVAAVKREAGNAPVVVVSALETQKHVNDSAAAGANGFLPKSASAAVMLGALKQVLEGGSYFPANLMEGVTQIGTAAAARRADDGQSETIRARLKELTHRQTDVLALVGEGRSNKDIAQALGISEGTVKVHVGAILKALGTSNRTQAALIAIDFGIAQPHHDAASSERA